ncbi:polysaccharide pyruvyl transferase family protein [Mediterraneibacter glycyrrhizinilyticus]|uniref:polysaccharide pyruvyl transferase family protein n=1 Tax=Mediterraneibacter glycyrrhizinilyticus TaxID=342942 RepID=UPI0025AB381F|nr:polysaccharide pyruvyl transferase family protein [Mediterraneibacter glycyrrhizinilyticus]MDN0044615.1 polysaccharide pyruvyl transferase family protein [Mediterraneibacter glycyrrhizinilyticus]
MKTATVTWITYNNYGTLLQAYALQQQLLEWGIENEILYDKNILQSHKSKYVQPIVEDAEKNENVSNNRSLRTRFIGLLSRPRRILNVFLARVNREKYERPYIESQELCEVFKRTNLKIFYDVNIDKLNVLNNQYDIFIAGSDQIWSVFERNFNSFYYLDFVKKKKIAYAPSLGTNIITEQSKEKIKSLLADFSFISVREKETATQLTQLLDQKVEWVADPTLLQDRQFWSKFTIGSPIRKKKYLLCYFLENREWYFDYAKRIAKKLNLDIVLLPNRWEYISCEYIIKRGVGPKEFVSLIQHADYVLTDSYHGSIFSLIFNRNFQYLLRFSHNDPTSQNIRIYSLFDYLGIDDRIVLSIEGKLPPIEIINYSTINKKIEEFRSLSKDCLIKCFK